MKRILSIDILRGYAIFFMIVFHVFLNISDLVSKASSDMSQLTIFELILVAFVVIFVHWQGFFLLISGIVNWYTMQKQLEKGLSPITILKKEFFFGLFLYIFGFLRDPILSPWGIFANWYRDGGFLTNPELDWELWKHIYHAETLTNLGLSLMILALIFYGFVKLSSNFQSTKTKVRTEMIILFGLLVLILLITPIIHQICNSIAGIQLQDNGDNHFLEGYRYW